MNRVLKKAIWTSIALVTFFVGIVQAQKPEIIVQTGHSDIVLEVIFSPDGRLLSSCSEDRTIRLWDVASGTELRTLNGHSSAVNSIAFSPDGKTVASASDDKTVKLWTVSTGTELRTLNGHSSAVNSIAFSPDGKTVASASDDKTVKLWAISTGTELRTLNGHSSTVNSIAFSPDGKTVASASDDKTVKLWAISTGTELRTLNGHSSAVNSIAFSPDGKTVASASDDKTVKLWAISTGTELRTLKGLSGFQSVAFSPDGKTLASNTHDGIVKLWNVLTGVEFESLETESQHTSTTFSPDGRLLTSGSEQIIELWDIASASVIRTLPAPALDSTADSATDWLVVTPDGLFDGPSSAWNKILWRYGGNTFDVAPVEAFFSEYFYPGLLADVVSGKTPRPAESIALKDRRQPVVQLSTGQQAANARHVRIRFDIAEVGPDKDHVTGSGVQGVRLFRNGSLVRVWRGDVALKNGKAILEASVPIVAGQNIFTAYAFNRDNIKSRDAQIILSGNESLRRVGTTFILAVGIDQYANLQYNLRYSVNDARGFAEELTRQQQRIAGPGNVEKLLLLDQEATKASILQAILRIAEKAQPEDAVIIYFSGHGTAHQNKFYLVPHDLGYSGSRTSLNADSLDAILAHSISDQELAVAFDQLDAAHVLFVIDSANSGQALVAEEPRRGPMNSKGLAQLAYEKGMYILTASQSNQAAIESVGIQHSYLNYALVEEGLKSSAADTSEDGELSLREWLDYALRRVAELAAQRGVRQAQTPRIFFRSESEERPFIVGQTPGKR